jgi:hypothetical protein
MQMAPKMKFEFYPQNIQIFIMKFEIRNLEFGSKNSNFQKLIFIFAPKNKNFYQNINITLKNIKFLK